MANLQQSTSHFSDTKPHYALLDGLRGMLLSRVFHRIRMKVNPGRHLLPALHRALSVYVLLLFVAHR